MKRIVLWSLVLLTLGAVGGAWWFLRSQRTTYLTDADTIREASGAARLREILWQPPALLRPPIDTPSDEFEPRVSADGNTLYFVRGKPGHNADIYYCTRQRNSWSAPQPLAKINTKYDELGPEPSADGTSLYFYSDRPGGLGSYDIWVSRRTNGEWQTPVNLGSAVNTVYNEYGPAISPDGRTLCFASNRPTSVESPVPPDAWRATVRELVYHHPYDLYSAQIADAEIRPATPIAAINSASNEGSPAFSPVGDFLYFASDRPEGFGGFDLYRSRVIHGSIQPPVNLGPAVNSGANELDPALDIGGYELQFSSDRRADTAATAELGKPPQYRLYKTFSREVYRDVDVRPVVIDWALLWRQVGPNLMWSLLALIALLVLAAVLRDVRRGRLSLLARCLVASLMIHALLMLWFNAVKVTAGVATALRGSGGVQVALTSAPRAGDIGTQIRGGVTNADVPSVTLPSVARTMASMAMTVPATRVELPAVRSASIPQEHSAIRVAAVDAPTQYAALPNHVADAGDLSADDRDLALPGEALRARDQEKSEAAPQIARAMKIGVRRVLTPTTQPSALSHRVDLPVDGANDHGPMPGSLVARGPLADARPGTSMPIVLAADFSSGEFVGSDPIQVGLPGAPVAAHHSEGSSSALPNPNITGPGRADVAMTPQLVAPSALRPQGGSGMSAVNLPQASLIAGGGGGGRESRPGLLPPSFGVGGSGDNEGRPGAGGTVSQVGDIDVALPSSGNGEKIGGAEQSTSVTAGIGTANDGVVSHLALPAAGGVGTTTIAHLPAASLGAGGSDHQSLVNASGVGAIGGSEQSRGQGLLANGPIVDHGISTTNLIGDPLSVGVALPTEVAPSPSVRPPLAIANKGPVMGRIRGRVTDYATGELIADARIRLDLPGGSTIIAITSSLGRYEFTVPNLPDFFAISASKEDYLPKSRNVANRAVAGRSMRLNFALHPRSLRTLALEDAPVVHHLGNDVYEGAINSQFQRETEGAVFSIGFNVNADQLLSQSVRLEFLSKGVQCPHKLRLNGHLLPTRMALSPPDGSFGMFSAAIEPSLLQEGTNTFKIFALACDGDLDDFEFVNLQLRFGGHGDIGSASDDELSSTSPSH